MATKARFCSARASSRNVWGVGTDFLATPTKAILIHGNSWTLTQTPSPGHEAYGNILFAVDAVGSSAWASGSGDSPLILRWTGAKWAIVYGGPSLTP